MDMGNSYRQHLIRKRKCKHLDRKVASDWVTCLHPEHPNAIRACSHEHCPKTGREDTMREKIIQWMIEDIKSNIAWSDADVSEDRLREIAEEKADDLVGKVFPAKEGNP